MFKSGLIFSQFLACAFALVAWTIGDISWLGPLLVVGWTSGILSLLGNRDNLLFFSRTIFIVWIGLVPPLALYLGGYFAWRMPFVQTLNVAFVMSIITTIALFSSQFGIELGKSVRVRKHGLDFLGKETSLFFFLLFLLFTTGTLIALRRGDIIFFGGYGSVGQKATQIKMPVQNLQTVAVLLALFSIVLLQRLERLGKVATISYQWLWFLFWLGVVYVAIWAQFLRGSRMDALTMFFAVSILVSLYKRNRIRLSIRVAVALVVAFIVLQVWGGVRNNLQDVDLARLTDIAQDLYNGSSRDGVPIFFRQGTMNNLSLSVATVIYAIDEGDIGYRYGSSYVDYIARTPPAILYPNRPKSLAWISEDLYGGGGAGGGFNEMAESYINFGVLGSFLIPGAVSFILSYSFRQYMKNRYNILRSMVFLSMLAVFFRGLLYQNFVFYKAFVTAIIIYVCLLVVHQFVLNAAPTARSAVCVSRRR